MHLAASYKKTREWEEAEAAYLTMIAGGEGGAWPYIELAKYYEHVARDVPRALRYATGALRCALNAAPLCGGDAEETLAPIHRRIERLRRRQAAQNQRDGGTMP